MTLKQEVIKLIGQLPDDSPSLREICEKLALEKAIDEGLEDVRVGRVYPAGQVISELKARWAKRRSKSS